MPATETPDPVLEPDAKARNRFFDWMRDLDVPRQPGWIGGVCAGIAQRIGIDAVIVRGIVVVVGVLGGPVFLLYAVAWLLLPDLENRIHLERMLRGVFDRAMLGIVAIFLIGFLPVAQGFWALALSYWPYSDSGIAAVGRSLWTLLLIGVGIWFAIWFVRRAHRARTMVPETIPATTDDRPDTVPDLPEDALASDAALLTLGSTAVEEPVAPPVQPAFGAQEDELAAWREQQAEWRSQHDAWKRQQAASQRELRMQRWAEARERSAANAVAWAERRRQYRRANPRIPAAYVAITLGAALVIGGAVAVMLTGNGDWLGAEAVVGLGAATLTVGAVIIVAGALRRRSGFLGFVAVVLVLVTVLTAFVPRDRELLPAVAYTRPLSEPGRYAQVIGSIYLTDDGRGARDGEVIDIWQGSGTITIDVPTTMTVHVEATMREGNLQKTHYVNKNDGSVEVKLDPTTSTMLATGEKLYRTTVGSGGRDVTVRIWQGNGTVNLAAQPPITTDGGATQ
ncbi:PspC domain-containing protein [Glaciihabitans sp. UYNi722]|uniref:PspC domain-containing protein n=1 Tax=Glaciihabitans sp. UYNi722 TaxID=3156344 RepID=UPI003399C545